MMMVMMDGGQGNNFEISTISGTSRIGANRLPDQLSLPDCSRSRVKEETHARSDQDTLLSVLR